MVAVVAPMAMTETEFAARAEAHRHELRVHCYRMLGSFDRAEDLVQETLLRAWRRRDDLREPGFLRPWLYKIATNACLDAVKADGRRVASLASFRDLPWLEPFPDPLLDAAAPPDEGPEARAIGRETIELAYLAAIQLLPPRQRAVLILRQVLDWPAADVADVLDVGVAAVNSALQRARATLRAHLGDGADGAAAPSAVTADERALLDRFIAAHESGDVEETMALIADDIRVTMPPAPLLFEGRQAIRELSARAREMGEWRLLPTAANRQPAAASYFRERGGAAFLPFKLDVLRVVDGVIVEITTFGPQHFAAYGLPAELGKDPSAWT